MKNASTNQQTGFGGKKFNEKKQFGVIVNKPGNMGKRRTLMRSLFKFLPYRIECLCVLSLGGHCTTFRGLWSKLVHCEHMY